jgi:hypothetical protein
MAAMEAQDLAHRQEVTEAMAAMEEMEVTEVLQAQGVMEAMVETEEMEAMAVLVQLAPTHPHPLLLLATLSLRSAMVRSKHLLATLNPSLKSQTVRSRLLPDLVSLKALSQPLLLATLLSQGLALDVRFRLPHHQVVP